jgi:type VI secretion system protein ImpI/type VI secretion system protein
MMLRLSIENVPSLSSGDPVEVSLAEHGLVIGRAAHADWTLPDPNNHVSSIHCEVDFRDGRYFLTDRSTNGTFINGAGEKIAKPVQLRDGDLLQIGHYQVRVEEVPDGNAAGGLGGGAGTQSAFGGGIDWGDGADAAAKPISVTKFGREAARPLFQSAQDPLMAAFAPPNATAAQRPDPFGVASASPPATDPFGMASAAPQAADPFGMAARPGPAAADPFGVSTPPPRPSPQGRASDPFGVSAAPPAPRPHDSFAARPAEPVAAAPAADPFGMANMPAALTPALAPPTATGGDPWAMLSGAVAFATVAAPPPSPLPPPAPPPPQPVVLAGPLAAPAPPPSAAPPPALAAGDGLYARLLAASGLDSRDMGGRAPEAVVDTIGQLLRQTADGLFKLLEARTRVRHQFGVGAQVTTFQRAGNNPLKWTRSPEQALKQMIGEPGAGFLEGTQAVRGAFEDLQAHEMAMMAAMQEAMQETIKRFAPDTIRSRISARGWLKSVLPGSREATLWRAYESEFSAFADESEAAYLDLFAKQFKKAYERIVSSTEG